MRFDAAVGRGGATVGREALRHIRARRPEFVPVGDGEGALDLKGDEARRVGRDRLLRTASRFCDELGEDTDFAEAVRQAEIQEAKAPDFPNTGSGRGRIAEKLAEKLRCRSNPKPEWVARTALRMFGVDEAKVKHYFDHR